MIKPRRLVIELLGMTAMVAVAVLIVVGWALPAPHRIEQLDKFCAWEVSYLRSQASYIREKKKRPESDYVQNSFAGLQWLHFGLCTSHEAEVEFTKEVQKCFLTGSECPATVLERLADAIERKDL